MIMQIFTCTKPRMQYKNKGWTSLQIDYYVNSLTNYNERVRLKGLLNSNPVFKSEFVFRFQQFNNLLDILFGSDRNVNSENMDSVLNNICKVQRSSNTDINNMYNYLLEDILQGLHEKAPVEVSYTITKQINSALEQLAIYPDVEKTLNDYL